MGISKRFPVRSPTSIILSILTPPTETTAALSVAAFVRAPLTSLQENGGGLTKRRYKQGCKLPAPLIFVFLTLVVLVILCSLGFHDHAGTAARPINTAIARDSDVSRLRIARMHHLQLAFVKIVNQDSVLSAHTAWNARGG